MTGPSAARKSVWVLPIVLLICAVMVLPGTSILGSASTGHGVTADSSPGGNLAGSSPISSPGGFGHHFSPSTDRAALAPGFASKPFTSEAAWLRSLLQQQSSGKFPQVVSLPNRAIIGSPPRSPAAALPIYTAQPAPMGIADYGLGAGGPYSYNTSHILTQLTLNAPPNVTDPGSYAVIQPGAANLGYVGSVYEFGFQLNTIETNVTIPGSNDANLWTQNVLDINDTGIHFVDDVFNFTSGVTSFNPGSIASGCGPNSVYAIGGVYQCIGETLPISASNYPLTISLYNNASVNGLEQSQVAFGFRISGANGLFQTGISDTVAFVNPNATAPVNAPGFNINGFSATPSGELRDAEAIFGGQIGGSNAVFSSLNGTLNLQYSNLSSGGWQNVPSAYNFGADTGETSTGIAGYWTAGHLEELNQGPSLLYGLWNTPPSVGVAPGDIQFKGSINPSFGFVFVGNVAPGGLGTNLTIVPTTSTGTFNTYLPPAVPQGGSAYYVQSFADGFAEQNGSTFSTSQTAYTITLSASALFLDAPLYMNGNAQAASLAQAVYGGTSAPYIYNGLSIGLNYTFNHLNDYWFPSFVIFQEQGVTVPVQVDAVTQAGDAPSGTYYYLDYPPFPPGPTGLLTPGPKMTVSMPQFSAQFQVFDSLDALVTNETLDGPSYYGAPATVGGVVFLWKDTGATAWGILAVDGSWGVFVGDSTSTVVGGYLGYQQNIGINGANVVDDVGSTGTVVNNVLAIGLFTFGVYGLSSSGGTYEWVNATDDATGVYTGGNFGAPAYYTEPGISDTTIADVNATIFAIGLELQFSNHVTIGDVGAFDGSFAMEILGSLGTTITGVLATVAGGILMEEDDYANITNYAVSTGDGYGYGTLGENGSLFLLTNAVSITDLSVFDYFTGVWGGSVSNTTIVNAMIDDVEVGIALQGATQTTLTDLTVTDAFAGAILENADNTVVTTVSVTFSDIGLGVEGNTAALTGLTASDTTWGAEFYLSSAVTVSTVLLSEGSGGVYFDWTNQSSVSAVTASSGSGSLDGSIWIQDSQHDTVTGVSVTGSSVGVFVENSPDVTISGVSATDDSQGIYADPSPGLVVSGTSATNDSLGVEISDTFGASVTGTTASNLSLGVWIAYGSSDVSVTNTVVSDESIGVEVDQAGLVTITGVTATNATLSGPYGLVHVWGFPTAAIVTYESYQVEISGVSATNYPIALYDDDSGHGFEGPGSIFVQGLSSTGGDYAMLLNYTWYGYFSNITSTNDYVGVFAYDVEYNYIVYSSFTSDVSYAISFWSGAANYVWGCNFVGNNGATSTYNAAHIQAYAGYGSGTQYFWDPETDTGNYWADWHTYSSSGRLAPYFVGDLNWDYYPIGYQASDYAVTFYEAGLTDGSSWSVTLNGVAQSSYNNWIQFGEPSGTFAFSVAAVAGYGASPASGMVTTTTGPASVDIAFTTTASVYNVTVTEGGLAAGANWKATFGGVTENGTGSVLTFSAAPGTYAYQISPVAGYTASPSSGSAIVGSGNYNVVVTFAQVTYAVTVTESGLSTGTTWSATVNGMTQSTAGTSLTWYLPNGTYTYTIANVNSYSLTGGSGSVTVNGFPVGVAGGFTTTSTPSVVSATTFNTWFAVAVIIAVIALVVALLAIFLRRPKTPAPAAAWEGAPAGTPEGATTPWQEQSTDAESPASS